MRKDIVPEGDVILRTPAVILASYGMENSSAAPYQSPLLLDLVCADLERMRFVNTVC